MTTSRSSKDGTTVTGYKPQEKADGIKKPLQNRDKHQLILVISTSHVKVQVSYEFVDGNVAIKHSNLRCKQGNPLCQQQGLTGCMKDILFRCL